MPKRSEQEIREIARREYYQTRIRILEIDSALRDIDEGLADWAHDEFHRRALLRTRSRLWQARKTLEERKQVCEDHRTKPVPCDREGCWLCDEPPRSTYSPETERRRRRYLKQREAKWWD